MPKLGNWGLCCFLAVFVSCSRPQPTKEAVEKGVIEYLQTRAGLDLRAMDVAVTSVSFRDKEAEATVSFRAKDSTTPANSMEMRYVLGQQGNKWVVKGRSGGKEHEMAEPAPTGALPPGHPPTTAQPGQKQ